MAKKFVIIFFISVIILILLFIIGINSNIYQSGRDTYKTFGDGRFQMLYTPEKTYSLSDLKDSGTVENTIYMYYENKLESSVYVYGTDGYVIVNYKANTLKLYKSFTDMSDQNQSIFTQTQKFNMLVDYLPSYNTVDFIGNGRYQLYKNIDNGYVLKNNKNGNIIEDMDKYYSNFGRIYIIKDDSYIFIDTVKETIKESKKLEEFEESIKNQFIEQKYFMNLNSK